MATFTNNSLNVTLPEPDLLLTELSTHVDFVSAGTVEGKNVLGVAFNKLDTLAGGTMATLSATDGVRFKVDTAYNNQGMGIILEDRSVCLFTAVTSFGITKSQNLTASSFDHSYEEIRRLRTLGYI
jgi:hypothetical protein